MLQPTAEAPGYCLCRNVGHSQITYIAVYFAAVGNLGAGVTFRPYFQRINAECKSHMACALSLVATCLLLLQAGSAIPDKAPPGVLQGHLYVFSTQPVEPTDGNPPILTAEIYAEYPLVVLSADRKKEIARIIADANGNYRLALPPGNYILDIQDRIRKHIRATPQRFNVTSNQTVRIDMQMDTGTRC